MTSTVTSTDTTTTTTTTSTNDTKEVNAPRVYALQDNGDQLLPNGETVNWRRGMNDQMYKIGDLYDEWIDHPKSGRIRLFDSDFLEGLTMTYWWTVPLLYIPWSLLELRVCYRYFTDLTFSNNMIVFNPLTQYLCIPNIVACIIYYICGLIMWTLFEYFCHRFAFHWHPPSPAWNKIHFTGHGLHHLTPADDLRLVFPPAISMPLGLIFHVLYTKYMFTYGIGNAIFGGFVFGYASYESTHFLSHHMPFGNYLQARFRYHSAHHFNPSKKNSLYGVTSQIWDVVFHTF